MFVIPLGFAAVSACGRRVTPAAVTAHDGGSMVVTATGIHGRPEMRTQPRDRWWTGRGKAAGAVALLLVTTVLMILPWTIRNAVELHHFIPVSDETGITLVGTYNPTSAAYSPVPYKWRFFWKIPADAGLVREVGHYTEPALSAKLESQALDYIGDHPVAPLAVAYHNTLRMFELEGTSSLARLRDRARHSIRERPRRRGRVLAAVPAGAGRDRDPRRPRSTAVDLVAAGPLRGEHRVRQRRDAEVP